MISATSTIGHSARRLTSDHDDTRMYYMPLWRDYAFTINKRPALVQMAENAGRGARAAGGDMQFHGSCFIRCQS